MPLPSLPGWLPLILLSALFLGIYDFSKKHAVNGNRVMPCLFLGTLCGTLFLLALHLLRGDFQEMLLCSRELWLLTLGKSAIVAGSWIAGYFALHDLPISLAAPIRASSPLWVTLGGILLFGERPTPFQALGMAIVFLGYFLFSASGRREGFSLRSRGVWMIVAATLIGSASALYDKWLFGPKALSPDQVQFHFSLDLVAILGVAWLLQRHLPFLREQQPFQWRWSIPAIGILLILADFCFFHALHAPHTQVGILAILRRSSVAVSFACGAWYFRERDIPRKLLALLLVVGGVIILSRKANPPHPGASPPHASQERLPQP